ncbi:paired amphipathic helix protein Sin3-like 6 isoform X3 [Lolium perenne]|uniref:paired amphipathic helix protein Sin3-like 6 isoform X3 n=1 Tax=Lolium perenne TaxID=4522 RepID=UPI0021F5EC4D|nr:paired amphipathic helix protein Sin3-like 6 isoform X3 [Lolium perenne]
MASPNQAADDKVRCKKRKKVYMLETKQCLLFARDNLPRDVYNEFVKTMTEIWKQCADPDGEVRSICVETCIEKALELLQGWAPVKQGFLNFTQGRSPLDGDDSVFGDVDVNALLQNPLDFLWRAKASPGISEHDYAAILQTLIDFSKKRGTMAAGEVFHIVKECTSNCPELLEEFTNYLPLHLKGHLTDEKSCRNLKTGRVGKANLCFTPDANQNLAGTQIKATNTRKEGSEESLLAEEDAEDKVEPLPDWNTSRHEGILPPKVNPKNFKRCTPSYYLLPKNCITLQSSYRTKLGRSVLNDALVSPSSVASLEKTQNDYEKKVIQCEDDMYESDMLLRRFRATADFLANLQDRVCSVLRISGHITPLHRRCLQKLYNDDPELDDLLKSANTSAAISILLSRLNRRVENLSEAHLCLDKILSPLIAKNYYRSLDHHGPSFKQLDAKRMCHNALLAEAKEIHESKLNAGDEYLNPDIHKDISRIISSVRSSEEKLMMTWSEIVHPFLSANCLRSYLEESVAPSEACEQCGISKDFLSSISDALAANKLSLSRKEGELLRKTYNKCSSSCHSFAVEIGEGEFIPNLQTINSDSILGPGKEPARESCDVAAKGGHPGTDTSTSSSCAHRNEPEKKNELKQLSKRATKLHGVKGGTCCSLVVLCRLYQLFFLLS